MKGKNHFRLGSKRHVVWDHIRTHAKPGQVFSRRLVITGYIKAGREPGKPAEHSADWFLAKQRKAGRIQRVCTGLYAYSESRNSHWPIDVRQCKSFTCEKCGHSSTIGVQTIVKVNVPLREKP